MRAIALLIIVTMGQITQAVNWVHIPSIWEKLFPKATNLLSNISNDINFFMHRQKHSDVFSSNLIPAEFGYGLDQKNKDLEKENERFANYNIKLGIKVINLEKEREILKNDLEESKKECRLSDKQKEIQKYKKDIAYLLNRIESLKNLEALFASKGVQSAIICDGKLKDYIQQLQKQLKESEQMLKNLQKTDEAKLNKLKKEFENLKTSFEKYKSSVVDVFKKIAEQRRKNPGGKKTSAQGWTWWDNAKKWAFKNFIGTAFVYGAKKLYSHITASWLQKELTEAIRTSNKEKMKDIFKRYKNKTYLYRFLDGKELAQLAIKQKFTKGLKLLLKQEIVTLVDPYNPEVSYLTLPDDTEKPVTTCKLVYNIFYDITSVEELDVVIKYCKHLEEHIKHFNSEPKNKYRNRMPEFDFKQLLNCVTYNPNERICETVLDILNNNKDKNNKLITAIIEKGALTAEEVRKQACIYLNKKHIDSWDTDTINTANIARNREK